MSKLKKAFIIITGVLSVIWFLIRVIPKPSRAMYPCQQAAFPIASGFVIWLMGVVGSVTAFNYFKINFQQKKYIFSLILLVAVGVSLMFVVTQPGVTLFASNSVIETNQPIGQAQGIFPGRVVWTFDPKAATWDGEFGHYWDAKFTNQARIDAMLSSSIQQLTGTKNDKKAWDALFAFFNKNHGKASQSYTQGEKIVIKINMNTARKDYENYEGPNTINATPQVALAMVRQLVKKAHVSDSLITVFDGARYITDNIYDLVKKEFPKVKFVDAHGQKGRILVKWKENVIHYAVKNDCGTGIATAVTEADYIINLALLKGHNTAGITSCGKNHFGSINGQEHYYIRQYERGCGVYNPVVDLMGHKELGKKTLLFMVDGIYAAKDADPAPEKWKIAPFNNHWPSSFFVSLDNVAIESVCYDFLNAEIGDRSYMKNADSYLHEAALAFNPPSKTFYSPNGDGIRLKSLGVHEHWNNVTEKKYSGNLGKKQGIELIKYFINK